MATLTWNGSFGFNLRNLDLSSLMYGDSYTRTPTLFSANYSASARDEFRGYGFTYDAFGIPTSGTVTSYAAFLDFKRVGFIDGASVAVSDLVDAASTFGTSDDYAVYRSILSGNDRITGGRYNDKLEGFAGKDVLYGRGGADMLYGGSSADTFVFKSKADSTVSTSGRDKIYDFAGRLGDKIDLKAIDAKAAVGGNQAFTFIGKQAFHEKAGELRYEKVSGGSVVYGDMNGDAQADFSIYLKNVSVLSKGYFIL
jgi:Ca2+-binding RTX toxin-like protein